LAVFDTGEELAHGRAIVFALIGHDHTWHVCKSLEELTEKCLGGLLIPPLLHQHIQDMSILIHRPPKIVTCAVNDVVQPHAVADNLGWEPMTLIQIGGKWCMAAGNMTPG
jgi:hypothetical protein